MTQRNQEKWRSANAVLENKSLKEPFKTDGFRILMRRKRADLGANTWETKYMNDHDVEFYRYQNWTLGRMETLIELSPRPFILPDVHRN